MNLHYSHTSQLRKRTKKTARPHVHFSRFEPSSRAERRAAVGARPEALALPFAEATSTAARSAALPSEVLHGADVVATPEAQLKAVGPKRYDCLVQCMSTCLRVGCVNFLVVSCVRLGGI